MFVGFVDFGLFVTQGVEHVAAEFHGVHTQRYGHAFADQPIEVTALRLTATAPAPSGLSHWQILPSGMASDARPVSVGADTMQAAVLDRSGLPVDQTTVGPALCIEPTTTTLVPANWCARADAMGLLHLEREKR